MCVSAREGISGRSRNGRLDRLKIRVYHPRARDSEAELQYLIYDDSAKSDAEQIIAALFGNAPKNEQCKRKECDLVTEVGYNTHYCIEKRISDALEKI